MGAKVRMISVDGEAILSWQMWGLLIGGIIWGIMGDKRGRLSVLFGSIILYSLANIANGLVQDVDQYKWMMKENGLACSNLLIRVSDRYQPEGAPPAFWQRIIYIIQVKW